MQTWGKVYPGVHITIRSMMSVIRLGQKEQRINGVLMKSLMRVEEAKEVCQEHSGRWSILTAYLNRRLA